ncbi:hypothetical protein [Polymorphobacter fuscus]|uniref:Antifreeze protein n=1 Tax=Sandarakinorhabdus fusca TaxID=1439888 RepID=A0A7C9GN41_9SPHN|nr:hypothetical protein [Polymorphobacter fuscus]KAB7648419.1 hypothetical protein F9290_01495 [Polymorphobacter fuscus]MQT15936.1 hypothetical protein [Polymorphobacter fuscus]NJC07788.1 hypothetical protein [Polymorphobacter fuscus]
MIKPLFLAAAAMLAAPVLAQAPAAAERPFCSATVTDGCQQTKAQQARAMTGAQVDARDAANGGKWTPDMRGTPAAKPMKAKPRKRVVRVTKVRVAPAAAPAAAPQ